MEAADTWYSNHSHTPFMTFNIELELGLASDICPQERGKVTA